MNWTSLLQDIYHSLSVLAAKTRWWDNSSPTELGSAALAILCFQALALAFYVRVVYSEEKAVAPYVGYSSGWEPTFWLRLRFFQNAQAIVDDGYRAVRESSPDWPV